MESDTKFTMWTTPLALYVPRRMPEWFMIYEFPSTIKMLFLDARRKNSMKTILFSAQMKEMKKIQELEIYLQKILARDSRWAQAQVCR